MRGREARTIGLVVALAAATLAWGCNGEDDDGADTGGGQDTGMMADTEPGDAVGDSGGGDTGTGDADGGQQLEKFHESCTVVVGPMEGAKSTSDALEKAFGKAEEGSVVCMVDGTYKVDRELTINSSGVTIRGESQSGTVLDFAPQTMGSNGILVQADKNFVARDFTIKNTVSDSLKAKSMDGVVFKNVTVTWDRGPSTENGAYALYPVESKNVLIEGCKVSYAADAGVYLGQSENAIIRNNEAFGNVIGIEIENTFDAEAYNNNAHDNTNGFLIINLPNLMVKGGARNIVHDNVIKNNNEPNFGKAGTAVANMPQGSGLLIVTADRTEAYNNEISGNWSVGIGVVSYGTIESNIDDSEYDVYPEGNWIHDNTLTNNGKDPKGPAQIFLGGKSELPQMLWDGVFDGEKMNDDKSLTNCAKGNKTADGTALELVASSTTSQCPSDPSGEGAEFCEVNSCTQESLESIELPQRVLDLAK